MCVEMALRVPVALTKHHTDLVSAGHQFLQPPAVRGPAVGHLLVRGDNEVVKVDIRGHGPQLQAKSLERCHPERLQVLKIVRVIDFTWLPDSLGRSRRMWRKTIRKKRVLSADCCGVHVVICVFKN